MKRKNNFFDIIIYVILVFVGLVTLYPLVNAIAVSLSSYKEYLNSPFMIIPKSINITAYKWVFSHPLILSSYLNTIIITISGVFVSLFLCTTYAYPISSKRLKGKGFFMVLLIITMLFNGGLIPNFYLINKLNMYDTLWALIIPGSMSAYYTILMINFFRSIPDSLVEAARIDGASHYKIFTVIMLPLSKPILATLGLFCAVSRWNSFFTAIIYTRSADKWTLQVVLREVLMAFENVLEEGSTANLQNMPTQGMKYAVIIVAVIPILMVYPFLQKYFVKGIMLGSVKG